MAETSGGSKRRRGAQPGNMNALKHGFFSDQFKDTEIRDLDAIVAKDLASEIAMLRVVTRRVMELADGVESLDDAMNVLGALGMASMRLAALLKAQRLLCGEGGGQNVAQAISQALSEVVKEMGIR